MLGKIQTILMDSLQKFFDFGTGDIEDITLGIYGFSNYSWIDHRLLQLFLHSSIKSFNTSLNNYFIDFLSYIKNAIQLKLEAW